jgi:hypothetical protein
MTATLALLLALAPTVWADPTLVTVGTHSLLLKDDVVPPLTPGSRKFTFNVRSGTAAPGHQIALPAPGSAGDPTLDGASGGGAVLQVYNSSGSGEVYTLALPASAWRLMGNPSSGLRYLYASSGAVWKVYIKGTKLSLRGGRTAWGYTLDEPSQGTLALRLTLGTGITWCTDAVPNGDGTPSEATFDHAGRFQAKRLQDAPAVCPPMP